MDTQEKIVFVKDNKQVIQKGNHFFTRVFENEEVFESSDFNTLERAKKSLSIENIYLNRLKEQYIASVLSKTIVESKLYYGMRFFCFDTQLISLNDIEEMELEVNSSF